MFKKIISNLPFNPGLGHQLTFYARRLHQEESIRRLGLIFTVLAIGVQSLAILSPAQTTLATSANDIIYGATSKQQVVNALVSGQDAYGRGDIRQIYDYYGITLADVEAAGSVTVRSREREYITTGRGDSPGVDTPIQIPGSGSTIYERSLNVWDVKFYENTYPAITGTATGEGLLKGRQFWILLKGCGNITFEPVPLNPQPEIAKTIVGNGTYRVGDVMNFRIDVRNIGNAPVNGPVIIDTLAPEFEFLEQDSYGVHFEQNGQTLTWNLWPLIPSQAWNSIMVKVRMRVIPEAKKVACNSVRLVTSNAGEVYPSNPDAERCLTIDNSCPGSDTAAPNGDVNQCPSPLPIPEPVPVTPEPAPAPPPPAIAVCEYLKIIDKPSWNQRTFEAKFNLTSTARLRNVRLLSNGSDVHDFGDTSETKVYTHTHTFSSGGEYSVSANANPAPGTDYNAGVSCEVTETITQPYSRITLSKGVSNLTQGIKDANNKQAKGGDELEYTLSISNSGNEAASNYIIDSDILNDILEYADLTSYGDASYDKTHQRLTWPTETIPANGTVTKKFTVKIKSPVPSTPASVSDPLSFDYKIRNMFGNEVLVNIDKPIQGKTYQTIERLPNTGPGSSLIISTLAVMVIGYFYARSRLLVKEVGIIRNELGTGV